MLGDKIVLKNLIVDAWIPVIRQDGSTDTIRPCDITSDFESNPIVGFNIVRTDFKCAVIQFLIGLMQTAFPPHTNDESLLYYNDPPTPETLQKVFLTFKNSFNIQGSSPLFLQDFDDLTDCELNPISQLILGEAGVKTLKLNTDFFVRRGRYEKLSLSDSIIALMCLQQIAPCGGVGHRTSLRGGGPTTTLLIPEFDNALWRKIWINITVDDQPLPEKNLIFPWLSETHTNTETTPENSHHLQAFWGMPRRIRLVINKDECVTHYKTKNYGTNYPSDKWMHPLTPYRRKDDKFFPILTPKGWLTYENWLHIAIGNSKFFIAKCIRECVHKNVKIWCFGYAVDNAKIVCWNESITPYYHISEDTITVKNDSLENMVLLSSSTVSNLQYSINKCINKPIKREWWAKTESKFFELVDVLYKELQLNNDIDTENFIYEWYVYLCKTAMMMFVQHAESSCFEYESIKKYINAKKQLKKSLQKQSKNPKMKQPIEQLINSYLYNKKHQI